MPLIPETNRNQAFHGNTVALEQVNADLGWFVPMLGVIIVWGALFVFVKYLWKRSAKSMLSDLRPSSGTLPSWPMNKKKYTFIMLLWVVIGSWIAISSFASDKTFLMSASLWSNTLAQEGWKINSPSGFDVGFDPFVVAKERGHEKYIESLSLAVAARKRNVANSQTEPFSAQIK